MAHGFVAVRGAATGGNNMTADVEFEDLRLFDGAQMEMIARIENLLQGLLLVDLDEDVGIDETQRKVLGENDADSAFTGTGHADERQIGFHGTDVSLDGEGNDLNLAEGGVSGKKTMVKEEQGGSTNGGGKRQSRPRPHE